MVTYLFMLGRYISGFWFNVMLTSEFIFQGWYRVTGESVGLNGLR